MGDILSRRTAEILEAQRLGMINLFHAMAREAVQDGKRWFPETAKNVFFNTASMSGEVGEALNIAKKIERGDTTWFNEEVQAAFREEIADAFTYMLEIVGLLQMDLIGEYYKKREFNEKRFGSDRAKS